MEKLHYEENKGKIENKSETIIFIHNNLQNSWIWKKQKEHFQEYHCIYINLPSYPFSIKKIAILIKNLIKEKAINKKAHLVGIAIGGQIILEILAKYPEIVESSVISGTHISENGETVINELKTDIVENKPQKFMVKAYLAEYGIGKEYFNDIKTCIESIDDEYIIAITKESLKFQLPPLKNKEIAKKLLVLYGTKEYPKIAKSAKLIENSYLGSSVYGVYRAIHLWNIIDYQWFNEVVEEFIAIKNLDFNEKPYLQITKQRKN
ncbi:MAG: alpha/beta hydrolase [Methanobrevibacter sp.]|jgi:pimeloyl-ACP methyl ester carboxylesterase|nr:alpha/beta hydrolase [Methanobrevibacter sp.]